MKDAQVRPRLGREFQSGDHQNHPSLDTFALRVRSAEPASSTGFHGLGTPDAWGDMGGFRWVACFRGSLGTALYCQFPPRKHGTASTMAALGSHAFGVGAV